jgi:hypothetical protein
LVVAPRHAQCRGAAVAQYEPSRFHRVLVGKGQVSWARRGHSLDPAIFQLLAYCGQWNFSAVGRARFAPQTFRKHTYF